MTSDQRQRYAAEIVKVLEYRNPGYRMSSADWDTLARWMDRDIPLAVVLFGMRECAGQPKRVTLRYYASAIEDRIRRWERALA